MGGVVKLLTLRYQKYFASTPRDSVGNYLSLNCCRGSHQAGVVHVLLSAAVAAGRLPPVPPLVGLRCAGDDR